VENARLEWRKVTPGKEADQEKSPKETEASTAPSGTDQPEASSRKPESSEKSGASITDIISPKEAEAAPMPSEIPQPEDSPKKPDASIFDTF
jgi:hypothetical protein